MCSLPWKLLTSQDSWWLHSTLVPDDGQSTSYCFPPRFRFFSSFVQISFQMPESFLLNTWWWQRPKGHLAYKSCPASSRVDVSCFFFSFLRAISFQRFTHFFILFRRHISVPLIRLSNFTWWLMAFWHANHVPKRTRKSILYRISWGFTQQTVY